MSQPTADLAQAYQRIKSVKSVKYDYARPVDVRDWECVRRCFTDDLDFEAPATGCVSGWPTTITRQGGGA